MNLLIVEDDAILRSGLTAAIRRWGHSSVAVTGLDDAFRAWGQVRFDGVLLDRRLGDEDGLDFLRHLRGVKDTTPVVVITARDAVPDRVEGLDAGADDYLVKPFSLDELAARLRALDRRSRGIASSQLHLGKLRIDADGNADYEGVSLDLARHEFLLLRALAERAGRVVPRDALLEAIYGYDTVTSNTLEVYIHSLRRKIGKTTIRTVRGLGYLILEAP